MEDIQAENLPCFLQTSWFNNSTYMYV